MRPADAANVIHDLPAERRTAVVAALDDERLADVLEELPEEDQVEILEHLDSERAADILEEMSADDAADLIADLAARDRRQAARADGARGGRGRPPADVLRRGDRGRDDDARAGDPRPRTPPIADALAQSATRSCPVSLAAMVYVCRQPLETPTGGCWAWRTSSGCCASRPRPWSRRRSTQSMDPLRPEATIDEVAAHLATYNLVAAPVVDDDGRLLGAVTVDDLLDHMLPGELARPAVGSRCRASGGAMPERRGPPPRHAPRSRRRPLSPRRRPTTATRSASSPSSSPGSWARPGS